MAGLVAGTPSGSQWGIGVLVADAAAGRVTVTPVVGGVADRKVRRLVGVAEAGAGELDMVVRVVHRVGIELHTIKGRSLSPWRRSLIGGIGMG